MENVTFIFLLIGAVAFVTLPRRWACIPLLAGTLYITCGQVLKIGPFNFTVVRLLVLAGCVRVLLRREAFSGGMNRMDALMFAWSVWAVASGLGHEEPGSAIVFRLGLVWESLGVYVLFRAFCRCEEDFETLCGIIAILLVPVAIGMLIEKWGGKNVFSLFGAVPEFAGSRNGRIRAQGPFRHAILAGTVGAVCVPLMISLWKERRKLGMVGLVAGLAMVAACGSSGPILSVGAGMMALALWQWRHMTRMLRWMFVMGYVALDIVMKDPAYFLLARIDLAGGSTGWHRAALIEASIKWFDEWWLVGTDFTRHWMPTGVSWNPAHTDITNYYIYMGITGGLLLMVLFVAVIVAGFSYVGKLVRQRSLSQRSKFVAWIAGATLFSQATTCISVAYFDQSFVFLYMILAVIGSMWGWCCVDRAGSWAASADPVLHENQGATVREV